MILTLHNPLSEVGGQVNLPGSKSISNRLLLIRALSGLSFELGNISDSDDTQQLSKAIDALSFRDKASIDIGHAGTDMRFLTAYLANRTGVYELTGSSRMQQRPIGALVEALRQLGADISYAGQEGFPPLTIHGQRLRGGAVAIRGDISSQFITALLLVAPYFTEGLKLSLSREPVSKPYIRMTVELMRRFGAVVEEQAATFEVHATPYRYDAGRFMVESDWSAASYYYSILALSAPGTSLTLRGLSADSLQADSACASIYETFGVTTRFVQGAAVLKKESHDLPGSFAYDFTNCPDIAQTLACTCAALRVPFHLTGLQTLKVKETDRIVALHRELAKLGVPTEATMSELIQRGEYGLPDESAVIETYHDHRMAMSFAPLALAYHRIRIAAPDVVTKSYPAFWTDLQHIGFRLNPVPDSPYKSS